MDDNEINYVPKPGAICQIAGNSRQQKRARSEDSIVVSRRAQKIVEDGHGGCDGQHNEEPATETPALLQLTKSDSAILRINEIEEAADDGSIVRMPQPAHRPRLAGLVDHVDDEAGD